ncbi:MAG: efflux transporter outer membrane subunit [Deferrisomatales bacterium]
MKRSAWVLLAAVLTACAGPRVAAPPDPPVPLEGRRFAGEPAGLATAALAHRWWTRFGDPVLDELVGRAVDGNLDLRRAAARVAEARAARTRARAPLLPEVTGSASAERARTAGVTFGDRVSSRYSVSAGFSYEVDLWGRVASLAEASHQEAVAAEADRARAYQALVAEVVRTYVDLAAALEQLDVLRRTAETDRVRLAVAEARFRRGLAPAADVHQTRQQVAAAEARVEALEQEASLARHRLGLLLGEYPAADDGLRPAPLQVPVPVPVGVPLDLLLARPDLVAAQGRYLAAAARHGAAEAERYPRLALTGTAGQASSALEDLTLGGASFWNLLGNLVQPLFDAGRRRAAAAEAEARAEQARLAWGQAVLEALREVEDVLTVEAAQRRRLAALDRSREAARKALATAELRYRRGLEEITRTLQARNTLLATELEQIEARRTLLRNRASLHLALGGDWGEEMASRQW